MGESHCLPFSGLGLKPIPQLMLWVSLTLRQVLHGREICSLPWKDSNLRIYQFHHKEKTPCQFMTTPAPADSLFYFRPRDCL